MSALRRNARAAAARAALSLALCLALPGCSGLVNFAPGKPRPGSETPNPDAILDFSTLYRQNCSGCHGAAGQDGPAYPLANPEYQVLVGDATLAHVISEGRPGSQMPAFARSAGGTLTEAQIQSLAQGLRQAWRKGPSAAPGDTPPYRATTAGDAAHGGQVYGQACASCHAPGGPAAITDPDFLALLDDQSLRTIVIAGRPDLGQPDWRGMVPGRPAGDAPAHYPLTDRDVTDVVAWLSEQRPGPAVEGGAAAAGNQGARTQK
jgi:cytochrome c oxidase cbb3-type subunit 3/ubiquinol-cytochrome c reductase cytochrome c subunit